MGKKLCAPRSTSPLLRDGPLESGGWGIFEPQEFFSLSNFLSDFFRPLHKYLLRVNWHVQGAPGVYEFFFI